MKASYRLSENAVNDLNRIYRYGVIRYDLVQADKYLDALDEQFQLIAENPYLYQVVDHLKRGYRRCSFGSDNIYYRIIDTNVEIMTILGQQDLENWL